MKPKQITKSTFSFVKALCFFASFSICLLANEIKTLSVITRDETNKIHIEFSFQKTSNDFITAGFTLKIAGLNKLTKYYLFGIGNKHTYSNPAIPLYDSTTSNDRGELTFTCWYFEFKSDYYLFVLHNSQEKYFFYENIPIYYHNFINPEYSTLDFNFNKSKYGNQTIRQVCLSYRLGPEE